MTTQPEQREDGDPLQAGDAAVDAAPSYRILVRDLVLPWRIGVWRHEEGRQQRVRLNLDLQVAERADPAVDEYRDVLCYESIVDGIRSLSANGHVKLAETLAHRVADMCLNDPRVLRATVRVEKLDAIEDAASVGVEITRSQEKDRRGTVKAPLRIAEKE